MYKDSVVIFKSGSETRDILYEIGVKQGDNMALVIFIYLMNPFAETLSNKWHFSLSITGSLNPATLTNEDILQAKAQKQWA
eukprot:scaffold35072_cov30-Attheya_sp.AAC.2